MIRPNPDNIIWKSSKYRAWIRRNQNCLFCKSSLLGESELYQGHHVGHSGGKRPSDHLISALCVLCHNLHHDHERRHKTGSIYNPPREVFDNHCISLLSQYLETLNVNSRLVKINALQNSIEESENE